MKRIATTKLMGLSIIKRLGLCMFLLLAFTQVSGQVQIGMGTSSQIYPFNSWYGYGRDAAIYTASEMNTSVTGGTITTLAWNSSIASSVVSPTKIYLKAINTTTAVASDTWANTISGATQVYTATPGNFVIGWNTIDITDFPLAAGQNLEVLVECNQTGGGTGGGSGTSFYYTAGGTSNHAYWQTDNTPPASTPTTTNNNRPNIQLGGLTAPSMTYVSSTTTQAVTTAVATGATNQQIVGIEVVVNGAISPLSLSQIDFTTAGTFVPADVTNAKVYYTGTSSTFATTTPFGTAVVNPGGVFSITGTPQMLTGNPTTANTTNYFWLTYDINCTAIASNTLDAQCSSITINGTPQTPTATNPTGSRTITGLAAPVFTYPSTGNTTVGAANVDVGRVTVTGSVCVTTVTAVKFNIGSTPPADISQAKCYYVTTASGTGVTTPFGSPILTPTGDLVFTGSQALAGSGNNFFWLAYDVACGAGTTAGVDSIMSTPVSVTNNMGTISLTTPTTVVKKKVNLPTAPTYAASPASNSSVGAGVSNTQFGYISIFGNSCINNVTQVKFNTGASPAANLANAKCFYTTSTTFSAATPFGAVIANPNGELTFSDSKNLATGANYFWIAYDVACAAGTTTADSISALPVSITYNGNTATVTPPATTIKKRITAFVAGSTVADGDWNNPATWACGIIPINTTNATLNNNVTVTTPGNVAANVTVALGKSLTISSGDLTMGIVGGDNKVFTNNGTLTVSDGTFNVNGQFINTSGGTFNQSGGNINVDPNAGTGTGTSVTGSANYPVSMTFATIANANLTGGVFTLVDPSASASTSTYAFYINCTPYGAILAGPNHIFRFGNGISTDAGSATKGFTAYLWSGNGIFRFGNVILEENTSNAASRFVVTPSSFGVFSVTGDMTIKNGAELRQPVTDVTSGAYFSKNLTVAAGGTLTTPGIIYFGNVMGAPASGTSLVVSPTSNEQIVSGAGTFRNLVTAATANFTSLSVNNTNAIGITFDANALLSGSNASTVSGTLTLTAGNINVGANTLVLGTSAASTGTYSYTAGIIMGKFKRWIGASIGTRSFDIGTVTGSKQTTINFTAAPTTGGTLTAIWNETDPGTSGLPLMDGASTYNYTSTRGFWTVTAGDGLAGGTYTATFNGVGISDIPDVAGLTVGKRSTGADAWALAGTQVAPTGTTANFLISRTGITGFSDFGVLMGQQPLEIKLLSFSGYNAGASNILNWKTVSEREASHFDLMRSADGSKFEKIETIKAKNAIAGSNYEYTDSKPLFGKNIYRLNMVDRNGKTMISNVVVLSVKSSANLSLSANPNPVNQTLNISVNGKIDGKALLQVYDITGKIVLSVETVSNNAIVDMSSLSNGNYVIKYTDNSNSSVIKIVKN